MEDSAARLFVALPVPPSAVRDLTGLPRKGLSAARWTHPEDMHITLRFLGDLAEPDLDALAAALGRVRRPVFHIEVRGLGIFGNARQAVVHAKVESARRVTTLCADITDALMPLGFDFGMRPFVPHVTLARADSQREAGEWCKKHEKSVACSWRADRFCLMRSAPPDGEGRHYTVLNEFFLTE